MKTGSQKQEPQSPTPGLLPSNSFANSSAYGNNTHTQEQKEP
jgi:hypothetical protein